jgi:hypothetical protein
MRAKMLMEKNGGGVGSHNLPLEISLYLVRCGLCLSFLLFFVRSAFVYPSDLWCLAVGAWWAVVLWP